MIRLLFALILGALSSVVHAQNQLGAKPDVKTAAASVPTSGPWVNGMEIIQLLAALVIVGVLLKWGLPRLMKKARTVGEGSIRVIHSTPVGTGSIHVVEIEGRRLAVASTAQSMNLLMDLTPAPTVFEGAPAATAEPKEDKVFFEMLDERMEAQPAKAVIEAEEQDTMSLEEARSLLDTAKRKAGITTPAAPSAASEDDILKTLDRISRLGR